MALVTSRDGLIATAPVLHDEAAEWIVAFEAPGPASTPIGFGLRTTSKADSDILDVVLR